MCDTYLSIMYSTIYCALHYTTTAWLIFTSFWVSTGEMTHHSQLVVISVSGHSTNGYVKCQARRMTAYGSQIFGFLLWFALLSWKLYVLTWPGCSSLCITDCHSQWKFNSCILISNSLPHTLSSYTWLLCALEICWSVVLVLCKLLLIRD